MRVVVKQSCFEEQRCILAEGRNHEEMVSPLTYPWAGVLQGRNRQISLVKVLPKPKSWCFPMAGLVTRHFCTSFLPLPAIFLKNMQVCDCVLPIQTSSYFTQAGAQIHFPRPSQWWWTFYGPWTISATEISSSLCIPAVLTKFSLGWSSQPYKQLSGLLNPFSTSFKSLSSFFSTLHCLPTPKHIQWLK